MRSDQRPASTQRTGRRAFECARDERELLDDPVLLRADELLALVEQDELVERVLDQELADDRLGVDLLDDEPACDGLVEADVLELRLVAREERDEREAAERALVAELERQRGVGLRIGLHAP